MLLMIDNYDYHPPLSGIIHTFAYNAVFADCFSRHRPLRYGDIQIKCGYGCGYKIPDTRIPL